MASASLTAELFRDRFGSEPAVVASAPGRVNLIGEHTDYNDGFVLPVAIEARAFVAAGTRPDRVSVVWSREFADEVEVRVADCGGPRGLWHDAPRGLLCELAALDRDPSRMASPACDLAIPHPVHANVLIASDVRRGAGLSSSAAVEMALLRAICALEGIEWVPLQMAQLAQRVEHAYVGVRSGIMDQLIAGAAGPAEALLIDCRTFDVTRVPLPGEAAIVVMDTGVRRTLSASEYNARRDACEGAVRALQARHSGVRALRDATPEMLDAAAGDLSDEQRRRARHVVSENERVHAFVAAIRARDLAAAGRLLDASHASLREDYEVSSSHLDVICELARAHQSCFGARLTGAGFGGCAVALVATDRVDQFVAEVQPRYEAATYKKSAFFVARGGAGARVER